jgi:hypothetical protein
LQINESNPVLASSKPAGVDGATTYACPSPGNNTVPVYFQQQLRLGYYTAVTLTDYNMGRVLDLVDELGIYDSTLVILTGDHGWQLGEHAEWGKHTNWELAVQVPLIIRAPWIANSVGKHTQTFIELLDLYKTISTLAGIDAGKVEAGVDGDDLSAILQTPSDVLKNVSFSQYSRCPGNRYWPADQPGHPAWYLNNCETSPATNITFMGYTIRTSDFRYTEWRHWLPNCVADWGPAAFAAELYSHEGQQPYPLDFDAWENENVATSSSMRAVVAEHAKLLRAKFETKANLGCPPPLPPGPDSAASMEF